MHDAILTKAIALHKSGRHHEALPEYERFLAAHPHSVQAIYLRAHCLHSISYHGEIIRPDRLTVVVEDYSKVLAIEPRHMAALSNRGVALIHLGSLDLAIADFEAAIALAPNNSAAHCNLGIALQQQGRIEEAEACFNRVLAIDPEHRHAKLWLGNGALLSGDYRRGLPLYEWRRAPNARKPTWLGDADISGKTIRLHLDGGHGDAIQFCRYVPMVKALGADVTVCVPDALIELMQDLPAQVASLTRGTFEFHCPLQSLPLAFKTELHSIPNACPYLSAPAHMVQAWAQRVQALQRPRIGLSWSGSPTHANDRNRSMSFQTLRPLFVAPASFVSLKNEIASNDEAQLADSPVRDHRHLLTDFAQTAALIENLDLVVTVDTSVAHLAGALGKPVLIMLPYTPDWRWMLDRSDSPWYPTARLFRQDKSRSWEPVIRQIAGELARH